MPNRICVNLVYQIQLFLEHIRNIQSDIKFQQTFMVNCYRMQFIEEHENRIKVILRN